MGDLSNPGIKPWSPTLQADSLPAEPPGKPKNTGVGSLSLLQGIFPAQELNLCLLHCRQILYQLSYQGTRDQIANIHWGRDRLPIPVFLGFPCGSAGKESTCNEGDLGLIPGLGRSPGEGKGYQLQYSGLENFMACIVHGVTKGQTRLF